MIAPRQSMMPAFYPARVSPIPPITSKWRFLRGHSGTLAQARGGIRHDLRRLPEFDDSRTLAHALAC